MLTEKEVNSTVNATTPRLQPGWKQAQLPVSLRLFVGIGQSSEMLIAGSSWTKPQF